MAKLLLALFVVIAASIPSVASACDAKAESVAASMGGEVLSVRAVGNKCRIKVLVNQAGKPPKIRTVVVSK